MFSEFGILSGMPNNILNLLQGCSNERWTRTIKTLWVTVVWPIIWGIWREKNSRIFTDVYESVFNLWDKILFWVATWVKSSKDFKCFPFSDLSIRWSFLL